MLGTVVIELGSQRAGITPSTHRETMHFHCVLILDMNTVGWIGSAVESSVWIPHVHRVALALSINTRKIKPKYAEILRRMASGAEEVFLYVEKLGLVCEE